MFSIPCSGGNVTLPCLWRPGQRSPACRAVVPVQLGLQQRGTSREMGSWASPAGVDGCLF